jgi:hypothetical protein
MNTFFATFSPENSLLLVSFVIAAVYCNWLVVEAQKQAQKKG